MVSPGLEALAPTRRQRSHTMTVYAIALLNIADRERYGAYQSGFMEIFSRYSGKLLAVDEAPTVKEGDWPYTRTVLIEFPDAEAFDAWFNSPEYQALAKHRHAASTGSIAVIKKFTDAKGRAGAFTLSIAEWTH
jgi:uncharacterized protein (DUF1330 family)